MTTRILAMEEWPRLVGTELAEAWPVLPPQSQIVVVEEGAQIVGCWAVIPYLHVEGLWIAPAHRGRAGVVRRLLAGMRAAVRAQGVGAVWTAALTEPIRALVAHYGGVKLPGDHYVLPVGGA